MAKTYRDIAIMLGTVEEAMSQAINWWGDLPAPMKEAIGQFRIELGEAIDAVEFAHRAIEPGNDEMAMFLAKAASRDMAHLFIGTAETGGNHELRKNHTPR